MTKANMEPRIRELMELKRMKEELDLEIEQIENEIKNTMGSEETLIAGAYKVTWTAYTTTRFDSTRFKKDHADLASEYRARCRRERAAVCWR